MRGRLPKDPALRQRRNKAVGGASLPAEGSGYQRAPRLPADVDWHPMTRRWWRDTWHSPMAAEYVQVDLHALLRIACLVDAFWKEPSKELAAELRLQLQAFGQTPLDRRRLQWEVEKVEAVAHKRQPAPVLPAPVDDPRDVLRVLA